MFTEVKKEYVFGWSKIKFSTRFFISLSKYCVIIFFFVHTGTTFFYTSTFLVLLKLLRFRGVEWREGRGASQVHANIGRSIYTVYSSDGYCHGNLFIPSVMLCVSAREQGLHMLFSPPPLPPLASSPTPVQFNSQYWLLFVFMSSPPPPTPSVFPLPMLSPSSASSLYPLPQFLPISSLSPFPRPSFHSFPLQFPSSPYLLL